MNPFVDVDFSPAPCLPCCTNPAAACQCALILPLFSELDIGVLPYADLATAQGAIAGFVSNCVGYIDSNPGAPVTVDSFTADTSTPGEITLSGQTTIDPPFLPYFTAWTDITVPDGATVSADYTCSTDIVGDVSTIAQIVIYPCATNDPGDLFDTNFDSATGTLTVGLLDAGTYRVAVSYLVSSADTSGGSVTASFTITVDDTYTINPIIAQWDDGGTTRQLEACPKLFIPPLGDSSGDWYASCADAAVVLSDPLQVSNCVGFADTALTPTVDFTATDGGTSLTLAGSANGGTDGLNCWGCVNCEGGETITVTWSSSLGGFVAIYDEAGVFVDGTLGGSSVFTSIALPYTGRYVVNTIQATDMGNPPGSAVITSSGTLSVNQVQALYDVGVDCPARLNCGDSCP